MTGQWSNSYLSQHFANSLSSRNKYSMEWAAEDIVEILCLIYGVESCKRPHVHYMYEAIKFCTSLSSNGNQNPVRHHGQVEISFLWYNFDTSRSLFPTLLHWKILIKRFAASDGKWICRQHEHQISSQLLLC